MSFGAQIDIANRQYRFYRRIVGKYIGTWKKINDESYLRILKKTGINRHIGRIGANSDNTKYNYYELQFVTPNQNDSITIHYSENKDQMTQLANKISKDLKIKIGT